MTPLLTPVIFRETLPLRAEFLTINGGCSLYVPVRSPGRFEGGYSWSPSLFWALKSHEQSECDLGPKQARMEEEKGRQIMDTAASNSLRIPPIGNLLYMSAILPVLGL